MLVLPLDLKVVVIPPIRCAHLWPHTPPIKLPHLRTPLVVGYCPPSPKPIRLRPNRQLRTHSGKHGQPVPIGSFHRLGPDRAFPVPLQRLRHLPHEFPATDDISLGQVAAFATQYLRNGEFSPLLFDHPGSRCGIDEQPEGISPSFHDFYCRGVLLPPPSNPKQAEPRTLKLLSDFEGFRFHKGLSTWNLVFILKYF